MSPSDLQSFDGPKGANSLEGSDDEAYNIQEKLSQVETDLKTVTTQTESHADVDVSATPFESHNDLATSEEADKVRQVTPILDEIWYLQERLLYLEGKVTQNSDKQAQIGTPSRKDNVIGEQDDLAIRKQTGQAVSSRRFVEKTEIQAEARADQRKSFGQGPNKLFPQNSAQIMDDTCPTLFHIKDDGTMFEGPREVAIYTKPGWIRDKLSAYKRMEDSEIRSFEEPYPHRGSRPPTALRPIYGAGSSYGSKLRKDARISRKLGPPTQWDESDSEEWSSDTSTRSRDFDYFRARLRGDFEWELDRLNAQVKRFRRHQLKKEARLRALHLQKENLHENDELGKAAADQEQECPVKVARPKLNRIGWETFRNAKALPMKLAYVIDVLTEEPKLGSEAWSNIKRHNKSLKNYKATTTGGPGHRIAGKGKAEKEVQVDSEILEYQLGQFNAHDPLPERIRINSPSIIEVLSSIRGTPICEASSQSLIVLRPFKILNAYEKEIRELSSQVIMDIEKIQEKQGLPDINTQAKPLDNTSADKTFGGLSPNTAEADESDADKTETVKLRDLMVKKEHLDCLQDFIEHYIIKKATYLNSLDCSKIAFPDLWYLFRPGMTVISADGKQAYQVFSVRSKRHKGTDRRLPWATFQYADSEDSDSSTSNDESNEHYDITIKCVYIHFDGHHVGPVVRSFGINKWDGVKDVAFLDLFPLRLRILSGLRERAITTSNSMAITEEGVNRATRKLQQDLIDRGRKFVEAAAVKHMYYSGLAVDTRDEIESQVMIDFEAAFSDDARKHWMPKIRRLLGTDWNSENKSNGKECTAECCRGEDVLDDSYIDTNNSQNFVSNLMSNIEHTSNSLPSAVIFPRSLDESRSKGENFTEDELMIMSYSVFGFVLRDRTWGKLVMSPNSFSYRRIYISVRNKMSCHVEKANEFLA